MELCCQNLPTSKFLHSELFMIRSNFCSTSEIRRTAKLSRDVDNTDPKLLAKPAPSNPSGRNHLPINPKKPTIPSSRLPNIQQFISVQSAEYNAIPRQDWDQPFPRPLTEVGVTNNLYTRCKGHQTHASTTSILAFLECVALAKYDGATDGHTNLLPLVVMVCITQFWSLSSHGSSKLMYIWEAWSLILLE